MEFLLQSASEWLKGGVGIPVGFAANYGDEDCLRPSDCDRTTVDHLTENPIAVMMSVAMRARPTVVVAATDQQRRTHRFRQRIVNDRPDYGILVEGTSKGYNIHLINRTHAT